MGRPAVTNTLSQLNETPRNRLLKLTTPTIFEQHSSSHKHKTVHFYLPSSLSPDLKNSGWL